MDENNRYDDNSEEETLENIVRHECGCRPCKCGNGECEFAGDFFDENGDPKPEFGEDVDLIKERGLEAATDYSDYAARVGLAENYGMTENGESIYHNTATYRMIDPSNESADSGKS